MFYEKEQQSTLKPCCICKEIKTGRFPSEYYKYYPIHNRVCYNSKHFIVLPSIAPLNSGHVLLFPKTHVNSLMNLPSSIIEQLVCDVSYLFENILSCYGDMFFFEHGMGKGDLTGCGIDHAHLHLLPLRYHDINKITAAALREYPPSYIGHFYELLMQGNRGNSYLLLGYNLSDTYLSFSNEIPSQFMRRTIAIQTGRISWDWKAFDGWDDFQTTYECFRHLVK